MEPLRFDVSLDRLPAATVVDGTVCPTCHDERVIVATKMIEVQARSCVCGHAVHCDESSRWSHDVPFAADGQEHVVVLTTPAFALTTHRQCKTCGRCRCGRSDCPRCP